MRIRALKPGFFKNEDLCGLSPWHRLCFEGLWCLADREGRLQDRPRRIKAEIFPYDDLNMDLLLWDLTRAGFIRRYVQASQPLIWIPTWENHQHPRADEAASELAAYAHGSDRAAGTDVSTFPAVRPVDTDPSLPSDASATAARMGNGIWEVGDGKWEGDSAAPAALSPEATRKTRAPIRAQDLLDLWNATTKPPLPRCRELTDERRRKIRTRIARRPDLAEWREAFEAIQAGPFYRGENNRQWVADFDWAIKNDTIVAKVLDRARTEPAPSKYDWTCPHEVKCLGRHACRVKQTIEEGKVRAS